MQRAFVFSTILSLAACGAEPPKPAPVPAAPAAKPEPAKSAPAEPAKSAPAEPAASKNDRKSDPAFALKKDGDYYVGLVVDRCPDGFRIADRLPDGEPKLAGDKLLLSLSYGGCPQWTGYAVVPGEGSPLPFHLCEDIAHDPCELYGHKTWSFAVGDALKKHDATAVAFTVPSR
jgi:hypothetical protein